jgi:hypothetical protein
MADKLKFKAVPGSLMSDPMAPGSFLGRKALPMPPDGWTGPEAKGAEARHPIIEGGVEVSREQRARWAVVLDALKKGVDLEPADEATRKHIGPSRAELRANAGKDADKAADKDAEKAPERHSRRVVKEI